MKIEKTVEVPAHTSTVLDHYKCDLCGKTSGTGDWRPEGGSYNIRSTEVRMEIGSNYGSDGGNVEKTIFDICIDCFTSKLIPWMASQGAKPRTEESDW